MNKSRVKIETVLVLLLSLGASAIYSLISLAEKIFSPAGLGGSSENINPTQSNAEIFDLLYRLASLALGIVPVVLALYLLGSRFSDSVKEIGLWSPIKTDVIRGVVLFACIGIPGIALYLTARALNLSARLIPGDFEYWWMIPILLLSALRAGLVEEVIMIGYLYKRLDQIGISFQKQQLISSAIRASYHAYQGFAGIVGNFIMGWLFGLAYRRWGRILPLVIGHFLLDAFSFVGYALLAKQLTTLSPLF